jgi:hypothetical protein
LLMMTVSRFVERTKRCLLTGARGRTGVRGRAPPGCPSRWCPDFDFTLRRSSSSPMAVPCVVDVAKDRHPAPQCGARASMPRSAVTVRLPPSAVGRRWRLWDRAGPSFGSVHYHRMPAGSSRQSVGSIGTSKGGGWDLIVLTERGYLWLATPPSARAARARPPGRRGGSMARSTPAWALAVLSRPASREGARSGERARSSDFAFG